MNLRAYQHIIVLQGTGFQDAPLLAVCTGDVSKGQQSSCSAMDVILAVPGLRCHSVHGCSVIGAGAAMAD